MRTAARLRQDQGRERSNGRLSVLTLAHKAWRMLPAEWRRAGMTQVAALIAPRPGAPPEQSDGAVVAGDLTGHNGIAESGRIIAQALEGLGLLRGTAPFGLPSVAPLCNQPLPPGAAVITVINAPLMPVGCARLPRRLFAHRRMVGMWVWELPRVPDDWRIGAEFVHDIWAPSRFCAAAFEAIAPGRVHTVPYPLAALPPPPVAGSRAGFGLPDDVFTVLTAFNLASGFVRKNPQAAIAAFRAAFGERRDALLVLKATGLAGHEAELAKLQEEMAGSPNIRLLTDDLPEPALNGLIAACDVVLSLHRAEGFGLIPAKAALAGKPVVATGWSGNLDFMSVESSGLVSCKLVPVPQDGEVYDLPGAHWAEPEIEDAAAWLQKLFTDSALRQRMGANGQAYAREALSAAPLAAAAAAAGIT